MDLIRLAKLASKLLLALAITWGIAYLDASESAYLQIQSSLHVARQIVDQAQSLSLYARERGEKDPVSWAARFLNSGMKNRPIKILPTKMVTGTLTAERYRINEMSNSLIYLKRLFEETGDGVQVDIQMEYIGFLGSHSVEINDLLFAVLFCFTFVAINLGLKQQSSRSRRGDVLGNSKMNETSESSQSPVKSIINSAQELAPFKSIGQEYLEKMIESWVMEARTGLIQIGLNIKNITQEAKGLVTMATKSKRHIEEILTQAQYPRSSDDHQLINQTVFEVQAALQSYDDVSLVTHRMQENISRSTESVIKMAQLIQKLKDQSNVAEKNS